MRETQAQAPVLQIATSEFILGGQRSGKSRRAEALASAWLAASAQHKALLIATSTASDDEMRERIARHRIDRALRCPAMQTVEEPRALAQAVQVHSRADTLVVVDCLTLWLTHLTWPEHGPDVAPPSPRLADAWRSDMDALLLAIGRAHGPVVLVSNETGLGVIPMGREVRAFVDALGELNQAVAATCTRVTLMCAGLPLCLKDSP